MIHIDMVIDQDERHDIVASFMTDRYDVSSDVNDNRSAILLRDSDVLLLNKAIIFHDYEILGPPPGVPCCGERGRASFL